MQTGFLKVMTQPVAGYTLFTQIVPSSPRSAWGQLPTGDRTQDLSLRDGDTIYIPTVTTVNLQNTRQLATVNFAADLTKPRTVAVVGEVKRPGTIKVTPKRTLNQVLTAGGFKGSQARRSFVNLTRLNSNDTVSKQAVPINLAQRVNAEGNPILQENDIIVVSRSGTTRIVNTLSLILNPAAQFLQCLPC